MRRLIKIILGIILVIAIILVVAWLRSRHAAQQRGAQAPTFRQFLGLGSAAPSKQGATSGGDLSADFTAPSAASTETDTTSTGTNTSQFTSGPISPTETPSGATYSGTTSSTTSNPGYTTPKPLPGGTVTSAGTAPAPTPTAASSLSQCSDADTTIAFTPDEIKKLNALQNRFYTITSKLHSDADIQNEISNHDEFKAKADQIAELYNYCVVQSPKIANPTWTATLLGRPISGTTTAYTSRIATPFWRDPNRDSSGYMTNTSLLRDRTWDSGSVLVGQAAIESLFRLNLW